jgi:hypothetical protein
MKKRPESLPELRATSGIMRKIVRLRHLAGRLPCVQSIRSRSFRWLALRAVRSGKGKN